MLDIPISVDQLQKIQEKYKAIKNVLEKYKNPRPKLHIRYKNAKRILQVDSQMSKDSQNLVKKTPKERTLVPTPGKKTLSKKQYQKKLDNLSSKNTCLEKELKNSYFKISKLEQELKVTKKIYLCDKNSIVKLQQKLFEKNKRDFTHSSLVHQPSLLQYLCSLTTDKFDIILQCFLSYIHLIPYPNCVTDNSHRKLDSAAELMAVLTVFRYGFHQGVIGFMLGFSEAIIHNSLLVG